MQSDLSKPRLVFLRVRDRQKPAILIFGKSKLNNLQKNHRTLGELARWKEQKFNLEVPELKDFLSGMTPELSMAILYLLGTSLLYLVQNWMDVKFFRNDLELPTLISFICTF